MGASKRQAAGERLNEILSDRKEANADIGIDSIGAAGLLNPGLDTTRTWLATLEQGAARDERGRGGLAKIG